MLLDSDRLKSMRLDRGWTQEQLAELCGVSTRTIQRIEKTGVAGLETTNALAAILETDRTELLASRGVRRASTAISLPQVIAIGFSMFVLGVVVGGFLS